MTVEFFDLARRLYAAKTGEPVLQVAAGLFNLTPVAIFVDAHRDAKGKVSFTVLRRGGKPVTARGVDALRALAAAGAVLDVQRPPAQLITPGAAALAAPEKVAPAAPRPHHPRACSPPPAGGEEGARGGPPPRRPRGVFRRRGGRLVGGPQRLPRDQHGREPSRPQPPAVHHRIGAGARGTRLVLAQRVRRR